MQLLLNFEQPIKDLCLISGAEIEKQLIEKANKLMRCDITQHSRSERCVKGRYFVMVYLHEELDYSLQQAGDVFNLDHATVLHGKKVIKNIMQTEDEEFYPLLNEFWNL